MIEETSTTGDTANDLRTVTDFHQVFPLAGRMKRQRVFRANDPLLDAPTPPTPIREITEDWVCMRLQGSSYSAATTSECDALRDDQRGNAEVALVRMSAMSSSENDLDSRDLVTTTEVEVDYNRSNGQPAQRTTSATDTGIRTRSIVTDFVYAAPQTGFNNWWIDRLRSRQQTSEINYLGTHALPGGLPAGFSAADVTGAQTATELFGWNTTHRKPACVYRIAGPATASAASNQCTLTPSQPHQSTISPTTVAATR